MEDHNYHLAKETFEKPLSMKLRQEEGKQEKTKVYLDDAFARWTSLKREKSFLSDAEVACFLLDSYERAATTSAPTKKKPVQVKARARSGTNRASRLLYPRTTNRVAVTPVMRLQPANPRVLNLLVVVPPGATSGLKQTHTRRDVQDAPTESTVSHNPQVPDHLQLQKEREEGPIKEEQEEPCIKEVQEEPRIKEVHDEPRIKEVHDEPRIKEEQEEPRIKEEQEEPRIKEVHEEPRIKEVHEEPRIKEVHEEPRIKEVHEEPRIKEEHEEHCIKEEHEERHIKEEHEERHIKEEHEERHIKEEHEERHIKEEHEECHIKEEHEECRINGEEVEVNLRIKEADTRFPLTSVFVKSENDEKKPQSPQLHQSPAEENREVELPTSRPSKRMKTQMEDHGGTKQARNSDLNSCLAPNTDEKDLDFSETEDNDYGDNYWQEPISTSGSYTEDHSSDASNLQGPLSEPRSDTEDSNSDTSNFEGTLSACGCDTEDSSSDTSNLQGPLSESGSDTENSSSDTSNLQGPLSESGSDTENSSSDDNRQEISPLQRHIACHSGKRSSEALGRVKLNTNGQKQFCCKICGRVLDESRLLMMQRTPQSGQTVCSFCEKRFRC